MNAKVATLGANAPAYAPRRGLRFAPRPGSAGRTHSRPLAASAQRPSILPAPLSEGMRGTTFRPVVLSSLGRPGRKPGGSIPRGRPLRQQDPRTKRQKIAPHSPKAFGAENNPGHPSRSVQPLTSNPALP